MSSLKKSILHIKSTTEPFYNARIIKDEKEIKILKKLLKSLMKCLIFVLKK